MSFRVVLLVGAVRRRSWEMFPAGSLLQCFVSSIEATALRFVVGGHVGRVVKQDNVVPLGDARRGVLATAMSLRILISSTVQVPSTLLS